MYLFLNMFVINIKQIKKNPNLHLYTYLHVIIFKESIHCSQFYFLNNRVVNLSYFHCLYMYVISNANVVSLLVMLGCCINCSINYRILFLNLGSFTYTKFK